MTSNQEMSELLSVCPANIMSNPGQTLNNSDMTLCNSENHIPCALVPSTHFPFTC